MGPVLVLATWVAWVAVLAIGGWAATARWGLVGPDRVRAALWCGFLMILVVVLGISLVAPLGGPAAAVAVVAVLGAVAVLALLSLRRSGAASLTTGWRAPGAAGWLFLGAVAATMTVLAVAVLGSVTHYDTGLYHWGAIRYAYDYPVITGMANLFIPLGYSNSLFPWAAFLGNGPWAGEGFRLVNGLFFTLLATDVVLRLVSQRRSVGLPVAMTGLVVAALPLVGISSFWAASPSPDPAVMILTFVSLAALADEVSVGAGAATAVTTALLAASMRPLMIFFLVGVLLVVVAVHVRRRRWPVGVAWVGIWAVLLGTVQSVRDYRLSGWLQYPLSVVGFDVPWRAIDPSITQGATLANARDPSGLSDPLHGWAWIEPWIAALPHQWEPLAAVMLAGTGAVLVLCVPVARSSVSLRGLALVLAPCLLTIAVWFVATPPSFRFAWGPILGVGVLLVGWGLWAWSLSPLPNARRIVQTALPATAAVALILLAGYTAVARLQVSGPREERLWSLAGMSIPYSVVALPLPPTREVHLASGLTIAEPTESDQCWARFPLCAYGTERTVRLLGAQWPQGFAAR